ncbi:MAG: hypothetical protein AABY27_02815 [Pseudomonadota bacterium]
MYNYRSKYNLFVNIYNFIYGNSPTIVSRIPAVLLKHVLDIFIFYDSPLTKDNNPTSSAVIREAGAIITSVPNIIWGVRHISSSPEKQDTTFLLGQIIRFGAKVTFQNLNFSNPVMASRASNVIFDSVSIIGKDLSIVGQEKGGAELYYFFPSSTLKNIYAPEYIFDALTPSYILSSVPRSIFKSIITDQVGEGLKLIRNSELISKVSSFVNYYSYESISYVFNIPKELLDSNDNIYAQSDKILITSNYTLNAYLAVGALGIYKISYSALPDLLITGAFMLAMSNSAVDITKQAVGGDVAAIITVTTASTVILFKDEICFFLEKAYVDKIGDFTNYAAEF